MVGGYGDHRGPGPVRNDLAVRAKGRWLLFLDDDDLLDPDYLDVVGPHLRYADVVYPWCRVEGEPGFNPNSYWSAEELRQRNFIPATAMVRKRLFRQVGGFPNEALEDWGLWLRLLNAGARFCCVPIECWTYRMNPEWSHRSRR